MSNQKIEIIYFFMENCVHCREFNTVWNDLESTFQNQLHCSKYNRNNQTDNSPSRIITAYGGNINSYPTILIKINEIRKNNKLI